MSDQTYLDWPFFDESHRALAQRLDAWARAELGDEGFSSHESVDDDCARLAAKLASGGWFRYCVPAAFGGVFDSIDVRSLCVIRETLARYSGLADFVFAMQGLGSGAISLFGSESQKRDYLPKVATGESIAAFALTELDSGSDVANLETRADAIDDGFRINGAKTYISNGGLAHFYVVFARTGGAPGSRGISAFIVDADAKGLEIAERIDVIAPHPLATVKFTNCDIPAAKMIGQIGAGFRIAMATLDVFRSTVGAAALGFARRALDEALRRARERRLFGGALADLQLTQASLADMALNADAAALLVYRAAWAKDRGAARVTREAAMAKLFATETAQRTIDSAVQLFGGAGVRKGSAVEALYREIRALRIYEGASEVQKIIIAKHLLDAAEDGAKGKSQG
ncbi:MAG: acyl-CoA dehydrogenase [Alphaproteobacteria bacterium]|nr:acyl-CoA dehydrogenase [Alphaproteobacteria bacterium]